LELSNNMLTTGAPRAPTPKTSHSQPAILHLKAPFLFPLPASTSPMVVVVTTARSGSGVSASSESTDALEDSAPVSVIYNQLIPFNLKFGVFDIARLVDD